MGWSGSIWRVQCIGTRLTPSVNDRDGFWILQQFCFKGCLFVTEFDHFQLVRAVYFGGFLRYWNWKVWQSIAVYSALWASIWGQGGVRALMAKLMWEMGGNHCRGPGLNSWTQLGQVWVCTLGPRGHIRSFLVLFWPFWWSIMIRWAQIALLSWKMVGNH